MTAPFDAAPASPPVVDGAASRVATVEDSVTVAHAIVSYQSPAYGLDYGSVALANHLWLAPGFEVSAGIRLGFAARLQSGYCVEGFGAVALAPRFRVATDPRGRTASWRPSLGVEVGATSAGFDPQRAVNGSFVTDVKPTGVYAALAARPLRFFLSGFTASAVGLTSGTMVGHPGRQLRLQIELIQIGIVL